MNLDGKGILITGASQGLGRSVAAACLDAGAHVCLCARSADVLESTRKELAARARPGQVVKAMSADVSKPGEVDALVAAALRDLPSLDGVVNNAGIYGPMGLLEEVDVQEWVRAIEINLIGTVLVCRAVLPHFRKQKRGKIVNLSGGGGAAPYPRFTAYAASKAAVVRLTETLALEYGDAGISVNSVAPGALNTRLLDESIAAGPEKVGEAWYRKLLKQREEGGVPLETGAALCVYLLSADSDGVNGKLISAVWDPWKDLAQHMSDLKGSDVYTLRRIVPKDRGQNWG